jgi:hypothetical protein
MKKMTEKVAEKIFAETFNNLSLGMLSTLSEFDDYNPEDVLEQTSLALIMFAVHTSVKMGTPEPELHDMINEMTTAVHEKMKAEGIFYDA